MRADRGLDLIPERPQRLPCSSCSLAAGVRLEGGLSHSAHRRGLGQSCPNSHGQEAQGTYSCSFPIGSLSSAPCWCARPPPLPGIALNLARFNLSESKFDRPKGYNVANGPSWESATALQLPWDSVDARGLGAYPVAVAAGGGSGTWGGYSPTEEAEGTRDIAGAAHTSCKAHPLSCPAAGSPGPGTPRL